MRFTTLLLVFLLALSNNLKAQNNSKKFKPYKVWITTIDGTKTSGILYTANAQEVKISEHNFATSSNLTSIDAENIAHIKIRKKGKIGKGTWIGAASGVGFGVLFGIAIEDDDGWEGLVATGTGLFFGIVGTSVGAGVGALKKRIPIDGDMEKYQSNLSYLQAISLVSQTKKE